MWSSPTERITPHHLLQFWRICQGGFSVKIYCGYFPPGKFVGFLYTLYGIPYKGYKKCPQLSRFLCNIFKSCLKHCVVPIQWPICNGTLYPWIRSTITFKDRRLQANYSLNVEGKLFFSLISNRLEKHIIANNNFINTSVQKGCMEKVPGCW